MGIVVDSQLNKIYLVSSAFAWSLPPERPLPKGRPVAPSDAMDLFKPHETKQVLDAFSTEIVRSYRSFEKFFSEADRLQAITYCESPQVLLTLFEEHGLEEMTVMVGDRSDFRSGLSEEDLETASRLERLRREGRLEVYVKGGSKAVHSKMYLIEGAREENAQNENREEGASSESVTVLVGSANLTKTGWGYQANYMTAFETRRGSGLHEQFEEDFWAQVDDYGEPFMEDLSKRVQDTDTEEERREVIKRWLSGKSPERPPVEQITAEATEQMARGAPAEEGASGGRGIGGGAAAEDAGPDRRIHLSLRDYDESDRSDLQRQIQEHGGSVAGKEARISPGGLGKWMTQEWGVPPLWTTDGGVWLAPPGGEKERLTAGAPPDPEEIGSVLTAFEGYFESVEEDFARTRKPKAVKAQMAEALFWFMWAPFVNRHAALFRRSGVEDFGKQLPFLYIWGESSSGKGTLAQYGLRLVSGGQVTQPLDGSELGVQATRQLRHLSSAFPVVFDDAEVQKIKRASPLRNYWSTWEPGRRFPAIAITSNDSRPPGWFQNRAKTLQFSVYFEETPEAQVRLSRVQSGWPRLFAWAGREVARQFREGEVDPMEGDVLRPVREAIRGLYRQAEREVPGYLPLEVPAEVEHDLDRERWLRLWRSEAFEPSYREGSLHLVVRPGSLRFAGAIRPAQAAAPAGPGPEERDDNCGPSSRGVLGLARRR